jgi:hypothetical protein
MRLADFVGRRQRRAAFSKEVANLLKGGNEWNEQAFGEAHPVRGIRV